MEASVNQLHDSRQLLNLFIISMTNNLKFQYQSIQQRLNQAAQACHQPAPCLLAVSKKQPISAIQQLYQLGQRHFGESYWQEAGPKINQLSDLVIEWHFIGPLQSNKTRPIAESFQWVHSIDRLKIAQRLNEQRPESLPSLNVCLQINPDQESTKSGISIEDTHKLASAIARLPHLRLRGLMCIPKVRSDIHEQRQAFHKVALLQKQLNEAGFTLDTLSMGMTGDMEAAIQEGSTIIRVGTGIFGDRQKNII